MDGFCSGKIPCGGGGDCFQFPVSFINVNKLHILQLQKYKYIFVTNLDYIKISISTQTTCILQLARLCKKLNYYPLPNLNTRLPTDFS